MLLISLYVLHFEDKLSVASYFLSWILLMLLLLFVFFLQSVFESVVFQFESSTY